MKKVAISVLCITMLIMLGGCNDSYTATNKRERYTPVSFSMQYDSFSGSRGRGIRSKRPILLTFIVQTNSGDLNMFLYDDEKNVLEEHTLNTDISLDFHLDKGSYYIEVSAEMHSGGFEFIWSYK